MAGGSNPPSATSSLAAAIDRGARDLAIPNDAALLLGVSGGPDSMALLHGAAALVTRGPWRWRLTVAHLDHGLRPDSGDDADFVTAAANGLGLPLEVRRVDIKSFADAAGLGLEEAGREARYRFFADAAPSGALIATAHTLDDAVETVLLNLLRGSGLAGVRGIPARRGRVVRPLLGERRDRLASLLDSGGLAYRRDPSNDDPAFLRNRIRAELLPMLESLRPGAVEAIARFAGLAADDDDLLDLLAADELQRRQGPDGALDWRDPPTAALGHRVLRLAIGDPAPSAERVASLLAAAGGERGGLTIELGLGRTATIRGRTIVFA